MISSKPLPPPADRYPVRRALLSVSDKTGLAEFAKRLHDLGIELLSTGGTAQTIRDAGLPVKDVAEVTGSPELLGGRVKTLHPRVHAGILARRTDEDDLAQLEEHGIGLIDLVVVNLYPFADAVATDDVTDAFAAENIDIGGPTMVRASAKNWFFVGVVTSPEQYGAIADELEANGGSLGMSTRRALALSAFSQTANYDAAITAYLEHNVETRRVASPDDDTFAPILTKSQGLRYGENPHQSAALYGDPSAFYRQLHGKELSFNNLIDLSAALRLMAEFEDAPPAVAILKHTNPCGVGTADSLEDAYRKAFATDRQSPFGGIVVVNRALDRATAEAINAVFTEIIIAPSYEEGVLDFLMEKKNRRLIESLASARTDAAPDVRSVVGGMLVQDVDATLNSAEAMRADWTVATDRRPSDTEWADLDFAWRVCKHVKSNAIVYAKDGATLGIGAGQMSRIDSSELAVSKGAKSQLDFSDCVVASDAFYPFADGLLAAADAGATAAIQPGGSVRDDEVIAAANERGMAMVFTGKRHFRH
ncbi:MAG: bifunctional phosphoribosylaminoimidazolecarboxamide formyltransferase/IMP cyclohydrolase [Bacteroidetes bacterium]|nr:bifunctional phosphoribosylaminoimidazolecarboxamide formyltransferase/IMP cyclohydrolase [Bacteroidota bacterium]